jgi:hypothetical protein
MIEDDFIEIDEDNQSMLQFSTYNNEKEQIMDRIY